MPAVDLLLARQPTGGTTTQMTGTCSLPVSFMTGASAAFQDVADQVVFASHVLTIPADIPLVLRVDNTDDLVNGLTVRCDGGDSGVMVAAGTEELLFCDGANVINLSGMASSPLTWAALPPP